MSDATTAATPQHEGTKPIVVGVDGSASSAKALAWAVKQAKLTGEPIEAVTTWQWPTNYGYAMAFEGSYDPEAGARELLDEALADVRKANPDVAITARTLQGEPRGVLMKRSADASMIVLGSRGHGEISGMLLGSVSSYCVTHAACPVLVIRG